MLLYRVRQPPCLLGSHCEWESDCGLTMLHCDWSVDCLSDWISQPPNQIPTALTCQLLITKAGQYSGITLYPGMVVILYIEVWWYYSISRYGGITLYQGMVVLLV